MGAHSNFKRLDSMGLVFYVGLDWTQWKPLNIPGSCLPLVSFWKVQEHFVNIYKDSPM